MYKHINSDTIPKARSYKYMYLIPHRATIVMTYWVHGPNGSSQSFAMQSMSLLPVTNAQADQYGSSLPAIFPMIWQQDCLAEMDWESCPLARASNITWRRGKKRKGEESIQTKQYLVSVQHMLTKTIYAYCPIWQPHTSREFELQNKIWK